MAEGKVIGQRIAALRAKAQKTGDEVAEACSISRSALTMYETGARIPRDEIKIRLANYFNVSVEELFFTNNSHEI